MKLTILGCCGGIGGERRTTALLLDDDILIDAGTGVGNLSLEAMARINHVFLTHCHLDHTAFLPLLADAAAFQRQQPLEVHALPETIAVLRENMLNGRLWPDYSVLPSVDHPYIRFYPLRVGQPVLLDHRVITPLPAQHAVPAVGFRFDSGRSSVVLHAKRHIQSLPKSGITRRGAQAMAIPLSSAATRLGRLLKVPFSVQHYTSWVYSGDTTFHAPFWEGLAAMDNLDTSWWKGTS